MRVFGSRQLNILLVVSMQSLYYYWIGNVVLTAFGYFEILFKACCGKS